MNKKNLSSSYNNESITSLKGADRVRMRPGVIFGSDGIDGCEHSVFEILSNSIDEAREGFGNVIEVTKFKDNSIMVRDYGRGIPVDFNPKEGRFNWELVFCELYAGGKYKNNSGENYEYSLGLNGLGTCATQYSRNIWTHRLFVTALNTASILKKVKMWADLKRAYFFLKNRNNYKMASDIEVFTDISIPKEYFFDVLKKQAIVKRRS